MFFTKTWHAGDTPPKGGYLCTCCCSDYSIVNIWKVGTVLPLCPCCGNDEWMRI